MALSSSFPISLTQIGSEFQDSAPHSLTEFLRNGSLVSSTKTVTTNATATAASLSTSVSQINRGQPYSYQPAINPTSGFGNGFLYRHQLWHDNGGTGTTNNTFTVNQTGTYSYDIFQFIGNDFGVRGLFTIKVGSTAIISSQQLPATLTGRSSTFQSNGTFSATAGNTITVQTSWNSAGWAGNYVRIGGTSGGRTVTSSTSSSINSNVATSAPISMSQFLGAEKG